MTEDRKKLDGMTPLQEVCNAVTMFSCSFVCMWCWLFPPTLHYRGIRTAAASLGVFLHLPFSVGYHLMLARRSLKDAIDCTPRRLDQSFIHVTSIVTAAAQTESIAYALLCFVLNIYFICRLWVVNDAGVVERMVNAGLAVLFYGLPSLFRGDYANFMYGLCYFVAGALCMFLRFGGWGHSLFHIFLGGLTYHVLISASELHHNNLVLFEAPRTPF